MNLCTFIGRIGKDAITRHTPSGKAVTGWSVAVDSGFGDSKQTIWVDCSLWGDRGGKVCDYIRKGDRIGVSGELGTREHDGKTYITLNVREVSLLGGKDGAKPQAKPVKDCPQPESDGFEDSEIPFREVEHDNH